HIRHLSWNKYRRFALVDTQPKSGNHQLPPRIVPDIVVDHHHQVRPSDNSGLLYDIRPSYTATTTILGEYLLASGVDFGKKLATALFYAIQSETQDFSSHYAQQDKAIYEHFLPEADA